MEINDFTIQKFNEHEGIINILVVEPENQNIYSDIDKGFITARSQDYNFKILTVREILKIDKELYYKAEYKGKKIGLFKPVKSIFLIPKMNRQIKIKQSTEFENALNEYLLLEKEHFESNKSNVAFSKFYAIFEGKIYETIVLIDEILCFLRSDEINNLHKIAKHFTVETDAMTFYNSEMTKKSNLIKAGEKIYSSKYIIPNEKKVKFRYNNKDIWISEEHININYTISYYQPNDINDLIIDAILNQYNEKLENYHIYYNKLLNRELNK
ncbi:hypothetical protein WN59_10215 [Salinicoccus sediminis]|uniref:Uncharacterized protein n=1 Tax=Salinicoccus sediminis TaxID=1432562 RepID=A0A0M2SMX9_9STAP|nr:hypothetical protein [Salinicoccus sediminis]KKK33965.1 hypothetical protein WN59_10215 [Salinicoccus sediminis]